MVCSRTQDLWESTGHLVLLPACGSIDKWQDAVVALCRSLRFVSFKRPKARNRTATYKIELQGMA